VIRCSTRGTGLRLFSQTAGNLSSAYEVRLAQAHDRSSVASIGRSIEAGNGNAAGGIAYRALLEAVGRPAISTAAMGCIQRYGLPGRMPRA
jgi:hypothetical protein